MKQTVEERQEQLLATPAAPRKPEQENLPSVAIAHRNKLIKLIEQASRRHAKLDVFRDFVTMAATAFARLDLHHASRREEEYLACVRRYSKEELALFPQMMAELTMGMEACPRDILGETFMMLELGNAYKGQFFTPYELCQLMAEVTFSEVSQETIAKQGFITVQEPACGAGAMIIAAMMYLREKGINYQQCVHVTAIDVDSTAAKMTFVQLSLLHVPATIVNGNSLTLQEFDHWHTPAHILGLWGPRLNSRDEQIPSEQDIEQDDESVESHVSR
ncbi:N-6 DNA methylase [Duganella sp. LjRoot269]|uniref:N-6 DNA methylase n=1 Tax=Duganella sp. LjRoot269 TaxID=3342305 RepID=UPI003ED14084